MKSERYIKKLGDSKKLLAVVAAAEPGTELAVVDYLRRLSVILPADYKESFFSYIDKKDLVKLLKDRPLSNSWLEALVSINLLPTPAILAFAQEQQGNAKPSLEQRINEIKRGDFNPGSILDVELEYSCKIHGRSEEDVKGESLGVIRDYLRYVYGSRAAFPFSAFRRLPFKNGGEGIFDEEELAAADATAKEAVDVLNFIRGKVRKDTPMMVLGNRRYGELFVVRPIEKYLTELGMKVAYERISSARHDLLNPEFYDSYEISGETLAWVSENQPDIAVVDGTQVPEEVVSRDTKFPAAMGGYIALFHHLNYDINFWAPRVTANIFIGNHMRYTSSLNGTETRNAYLISAAEDKYHGGSGAFFDDPEKLAAKEKFFFCRTGLASGYLWERGVVEYVIAAVKCIEAKVSELMPTA